MRPVMHGDVVAVARALFAEPQAQRAVLLGRLIARAEAADVHRLTHGRPHALWGDGSLMAAALALAPPPEPTLEDPDYCSCMAQVFDALVTRRRSSHRSVRSSRAASA